MWIEADTYPEHSAIIHKISHPASSPKSHTPSKSHNPSKSHISSKSHNPNPSQSLPLSHKRKNIVTLGKHKMSSIKLKQVLEFVLSLK